MGKAMLQIGAVFAEMERNLLRERTKAGLAAARARGRLGGRKPRLSADGLDTARRLMADPLLTMEEIASRLGIGRTTLYRALGRVRAARGAPRLDAHETTEAEQSRALLGYQLLDSWHQPPGYGNDGTLDEVVLTTWVDAARALAAVHKREAIGDQQIGRVLLTKHRMVGRVEVEEKPDVLWDHPELERLYARLEDEYELAERSRGMERKLALISETVGAVLELVQDQRSVRLEWYIIGLIAIEIMLSLGDLILRTTR